MRKQLGALWLAVMLAGCQTDQSAVVATAPISTQVQDTFVGSKAEVIRLAIKAIQAKGWKLGDVNESVGLVSFETAMSMGSWSGIKANLILEEAGRPNLYRVSGTAKQNLQGGQVAAFDIGNESQSVVKEAIATMRAMPSPRA